MGCGKVFKAVISVAAPIIGNYFLPGIGGSILGGAIGGLAGGGGIQGALLGAGLGAAGYGFAQSGIADKFSSGLSSFGGGSQVAGTGINFAGDIGSGGPGINLATAGLGGPGINLASSGTELASGFGSTNLGGYLGNTSYGNQSLNAASAIPTPSLNAATSPNLFSSGSGSPSSSVSPASGVGSQPSSQLKLPSSIGGSGSVGGSVGGSGGGSVSPNFAPSPSSQLPSGNTGLPSSLGGAPTGAADASTGINFTPGQSTFPGDAPIASKATGVTLPSSSADVINTSGIDKTVAPATSATEKTGTGFIDSLGHQLKNNALSLGVGALGMLQTPKLPTQLQSVSDNASTTQALGKNLISSSQSGTVTPAQDAQIQLWTQQNKSGVRDYYAKAGLGDSSMMQSAMANVDSQASAMREQIIQQNLSQGLSALGMSDASNTALASAKMKQDDGTSTMLANLSKALGANAGQTQSSSGA